MEKRSSIDFLKECIEQLDSVTSADVEKMEKIYEANQLKCVVDSLDFLIPEKGEWEEYKSYQVEFAKIDIQLNQEEFYRDKTINDGNIDSTNGIAA